MELFIYLQCNVNYIGEYKFFWVFFVFVFVFVFSLWCGRDIGNCQYLCYSPLLKLVPQVLSCQNFLVFHIGSHIDG